MDSPRSRYGGGRRRDIYCSPEVANSTRRCVALEAPIADRSGPLRFGRPRNRSDPACVRSTSPWNPTCRNCTKLSFSALQMPRFNTPVKAPYFVLQLTAVRPSFHVPKHGAPFTSLWRLAPFLSILPENLPGDPTSRRHAPLPQQGFPPASVASSGPDR